MGLRTPLKGVRRTHLKGIASVTEHHDVSSDFYRFFPFAVFMGFIGLEELIRFLAGQGLFKLEVTTLYYLYPVKTLAVGLLLYLLKEHYQELSFKDLTKIPATLAAIGIGLLVFALWIKLTWTLGVANVPQGFNPSLLPGRAIQITMTLFRVAGAILVVPLMEELFWRSFLIRYIIDKDFDKVPMGTFTWGSFLITVVLFGFEHNYILAGMVAGIFYNLLLYKTRSLAQCVLSHAATNLLLSLYVVSTGKWQFW